MTQYIVFHIDMSYRVFTARQHS